MGDKYVRHTIIGNVDYTHCSTDNNCVSIAIDYGENAVTEEVTPATYAEEEAAAANAEVTKAIKAPPAPSSVLNRARMVLSERDTSQKQFTALKSRDTFFSVLKFETGAVIVVGLQDPALTVLCVTKAVTAISDTLKYPIKIKRVSIVNTVSTFNRFHLNFTSLREFFNRHCIAYIYNPETFPGMFFKLRVPARKLEEGETMGEYYTKVASMRDSPSYDLTFWFRVKTVLTFKVGKNTVLGECGKDDVSIISRLLFGFFHYFMDHNIKMSYEEVKRLRKRYGIPPLEWYLHVDVFFHSHPYVKPTRDALRRAMVAEQQYSSSIDTTYYGTCADAPMSANLVPSLKESAKIVDAMASQKLCGVRDRSLKALLLVSKDVRGRRTWRSRGARPDPFGLVHLGSTSEPLPYMMNTCWLKKEETEQLVGCCYEEIVKECEAAKLIPAPYIRNWTPTDAQLRMNHNKSGGGYSFRGSNKKVEAERKKCAVDLARLSTHMAAYRILCVQLATGSAPKLARLYGTDVYSLLQLVRRLPLSAGHAASTVTYKTPGDAYFSTIDADNNTIAVPTARKLPATASSSSRRSKCEVCGEPCFVNLCQKCEEQSTQYIQRMLLNIRGKKRHRDALPRDSKKKKCTPSDFIDSVVRFDDEGTPKVGLQFNVRDILNTLLSGRGIEDRPTANYRTSLHTDTQNKSNLSKLLVAALREHGITEEEAKAFKTFLESSTGLSTLSEFRRARTWQK